MSLPAPLPVDPARAALAVIVAFLALRVVLAATLGFGIDESYTLGQARNLSLSYFDHPPLHIWMAHVGLLAFGPSWLVRLPFVALFAGTSWLTFLISRRLFSAEAGVWAVIALNASLFFLAAPGTWVLPDGPLLFFLAAGVWALARLFFPGNGEAPSPWRAWLVAGLCFGLAGLSKYSAAIVALGLLPFLLLTPHRRWLVHPAPYVAGIVALLVVSPAILWNLQHDWASFRFQAGRSAASGLKPAAFLQMLAGQFAWLAPWVGWPLAWATVAAMKDALEPRRLLLFALALPSILYFTIQSLWSGAALPHWPMPGWFFCFPLLGAWLVANPGASPSPKAWARFSFMAAAALVVSIGVLARTGALTAIPGVTARNDPTFDAFDWWALREALIARGVGAPGGPIVAGLRWNETGKVDFVIGDIAPVIVLNADARHFAYRQPDRSGPETTLVVVASRAAFERDRAIVSARVGTLAAPEIVTIGRMGRPELEIVVARGVGLRPSP